MDADLHVNSSQVWQLIELVQPVPIVAMACAVFCSVRWDCLAADGNVAFPSPVLRRSVSLRVWDVLSWCWCGRPSAGLPSSHAVGSAQSPHALMEGYLQRRMSELKLLWRQAMLE